MEVLCVTACNLWLPVIGWLRHILNLLFWRSYIVNDIGHWQLECHMYQRFCQCYSYGTVKILSSLGSLHWSCLLWLALCRSTWSQIIWFLMMWWFSPNWPWWMRVAVQEVWMLRRCESVSVRRKQKQRGLWHQSSLIQCHSDWPVLAQIVKSRFLSFGYS